MVLYWLCKLSLLLLVQRLVCEASLESVAIVIAKDLPPVISSNRYLDAPEAHDDDISCIGAPSYISVEALEISVDATDTSPDESDIIADETDISVGVLDISIGELDMPVTN